MRICGSCGWGWGCSGVGVGPRDLLIADHRRLFGRADVVSWDPSAPAVEVRAAQMQHAAARDFYAALKARGESVADAAEAWLLNAEGLRRKLRGETWASLRDLAMWELYDS